MQESCGEPGRKDTGLSAVMEKFATYFGLKLSFLECSATKQLSVTIQGHTVNAQEATSAVQITKMFLGDSV